jgi:hypothetical protein
MVLNDGVADTLASAMAPHGKGLPAIPGCALFSSTDLLLAEKYEKFWPKSTKKGATMPVTTGKRYRDPLLGLGPFYVNRPLGYSSPSPSLRLIG